MRIITRSELKGIIKHQQFWDFFPEYNDLKEKIKEKKIKIGCCNTSSEFFQEMLTKIKSNPGKWKQYFKTDKIQIYDGRLIEL